MESSEMVTVVTMRVLVLVLRSAASTEYVHYSTITRSVVRSIRTREIGLTGAGE